MTSTWRAAADALAADLRSIFGVRLLSVVAYGAHVDGQASADEPVRCLALVSALGVSDLDACARLASSWHHRGLGTPLILSDQEFRRSLDAFPLEYGEIIRAHAEVYGGDPFHSLAIEPADLRRALETQVKSHLLHLREDYMEAAGRPSGVAELVTTSIPAFAALLRNVARLHGVDTTDRAAVTREGGAIAGLPEDIVAGVVGFEQRAGLGSTDPARFFSSYLAAVEQLAAFVDAWRAGR